jgi:hypothetical protein
MGVMPHWKGQGDYDCLETLERQDPSFDRAHEDQQNQRAAEQLGIAGSMEVWTWENWMQIEAVGGMAPHCSTCLMLDTTAQPLNPGRDSDDGDIRILTGLIGQTNAIITISDRLGLGTGPTIDYFLSDDYVLRALAYMEAPTLNAQELYTSMEDWVNAYAAPSDGYSLFDPNTVLTASVWERVVTNSNAQTRA